MVVRTYEQVCPNSDESVLLDSYRRLRECRDTAICGRQDGYTTPLLHRQWLLKPYRMQWAGVCPYSVALALPVAALSSNNVHVAPVSTAGAVLHQSSQ